MMCWIFHSPNQTQNFRTPYNSTMATPALKLADIPEQEVEESETSDPSVSEEEQEERRQEEQKFYDRLIQLTRTKGETSLKELDHSDFQFLTDFAICNITLTVYRELQNNSFFTKTEDPDESVGSESPESTESDLDAEQKAQLQRLQDFETRGVFRLCQLYPLVLRATIGYYSSIAINYYEDTIEQRRYDQIPIGLNDKAYSIVCSSVRKLVEKEIEFRGVD